MKRDIAEKWAAALKSGEFKQGDGVLMARTRDDGVMYCCLGVLCVLAERDGVPLKYVQERGEDSVAINEHTILPPESVWRDYAELRSQRGNVDVGLDLALLNDVGNSFTEIADIILEKSEIL